MDEAETGLKSLLAVKIFGADLKTLEQRAEQVRDILSRVRGITHIVIVRELGQPSLINQTRSCQNRALWLKRQRREHLD